MDISILSNSISIWKPNCSSADLVALPLKSNVRLSLAHVILAHTSPFVAPLTVAWLETSAAGDWRIRPLVYAPYGANIVADRIEAKGDEYRVLSSGLAVPDNGIVTADAASGVAAYVGPASQMSFQK